MVVADDDATALRIAHRAYPIWHRSFNHLFQLRGSSPRHPRPPDFDGVMASGQGIAGSPDTVRAFLQSQLDTAGAGYLVGQFAFGDVSLDEALRSVGLFSENVMPALG